MLTLTLLVLSHGIMIQVVASARNIVVEAARVAESMSP
jgi:hypothetical protein